MIDFQLPGESSAAHKGPSLQALPGALGLRSGRAASGAAATVKCIGRRRHPPAFGRAAPVPAPFARPRPSKACSPLRSSAFSCLSGASAGRDATVHHPEHQRPSATASLAPQVAAQSSFYHLPLFRRAPPSLAVSELPSPTHTSRPSPPRPTPGALISVLCDLDRSALRLPASFEKKTHYFQQRLRRCRFGFLRCEGGCRRRFSAVRVAQK